MKQKINATVSGSFHRHIFAITESVNDLRERDVNVLSPKDPRVVDYIGDFLFVASDRVRSIKLVQDRHNEAIKRSDFLWLVNPDGYVGPSASMELGIATALGTPVFSTHAPTDTTLRKYVELVPSAEECLRIVRARKAAGGYAADVADDFASILLNPAEVVDITQRDLEVVKATLLSDATRDEEATNVLGNFKRRFLGRYGVILRDFGHEGNGKR